MLVNGYCQGQVQKYAPISLIVGGKGRVLVEAVEVILRVSVTWCGCAQSVGSDFSEV